MMSCSLHSPAPKGLIACRPLLVQPRRGDPAQPRPTAWVNRRPVLPRSPERAQYELRAQSHLSRPFRARNINRLGLLTQAVSLG